MRVVSSPLHEGDCYSPHHLLHSLLRVGNILLMLLYYLFNLFWGQNLISHRLTLLFAKFSVGNEC